MLNNVQLGIAWLPWLVQQIANTLSESIMQISLM